MQPSNKELVFNAQSILKQFGYKVKTTHLHELFARLAGFKNIHEATANQDQEEEEYNSYYEQEVKAFENYLETRKERDDAPLIGNTDFEDVLKFHAYVTRRFGLATRAIQAMIVGEVIEEHQPALTHGTEETIQEGMKEAENLWAGRGDAELNRYVPLGFTYTQNAPSEPRDTLDEYSPPTKEEAKKLKVMFRDSSGVVEVIKGPNKGMIAYHDNDEEGKAILYPYHADGNLCLGEYFMIPYTHIRALSGEKVTE